MRQKLPRIFLYCLGAILLLNLVQSYFTELIFDEAYYWHYAQNMAWGYFDHPPMVALLVKLSSFFFSGELGVRFMSCLMSVGLFLAVWACIDGEKKKEFVPHFFVLGLSMTLLNAYGFLTLPDTPLLFFTAVFLWVYKKFISQPTLVKAVLLGIVMSCLMYSKYHAVLVILFVLASNLKLLRNGYAWLAVLVALACYTPHFVWLYENDFVAIKYHLFERPNRAYEFGDFTLGYFINLIALFGLIFPLVYYALFKTKFSNTFTRALLFLTYGVLLFFFISSFNRRVQTQWIIVICIPVFIVVFNYMLTHAKLQKWIYRIGLINLVLLCYARVWLVYQPLLPITYESHGNTTWVKAITDQIGDTPVVFENSYRNAPMYSFYSGTPAYSLNNLHYRQNQYSIDRSETAVQHQKVLYVSKYAKTGDISYSTAKGNARFGSYIANFESFRKLQCHIEEEEIQLDPEKDILLKVYNPYAENIDLKKLNFGVAYTNAYKEVKEVARITAVKGQKDMLFLKAKDTTTFTIRLPETTLKELGYFKIGISENNLYYGINGRTIKVIQ